MARDALNLFAIRVSSTENVEAFLTRTQHDRQNLATKSRVIKWSAKSLGKTRTARAIRDSRISIDGDGHKVRSILRIL